MPPAQDFSMVLAFDGVKQANAPGKPSILERAKRRRELSLKCFYDRGPAVNELFIGFVGGIVLGHQPVLKRTHQGAGRVSPTVALNRNVPPLFKKIARSPSHPRRFYRRQRCLSVAECHANSTPYSSGHRLQT